MTAPRLRILEAGTATYTPGPEGWSGAAAAYVYTFVNIEVNGRGVSTGRACAPLGGSGATLAETGTPEDLLQSAIEACEAYVSFRRWDTAFGHHLHRLPQCGRAGPAGQADVPCRFGYPLMDAAILDGLLRAVGRNFEEAMACNLPGVTACMSPGLTNEHIEQCLAASPTPGGAMASRSNLQARTMAGSLETVSGEVGLARNADTGLGRDAAQAPCHVAAGREPAPAQLTGLSGNGAPLWETGIYGAVLQALEGPPFPSEPSCGDLPVLLDAVACLQNRAVRALIDGIRCHRARAVKSLQEDALFTYCETDTASLAPLLGPGFATHGLKVPESLEWL
ncbi:hypothetical protein [Roseibium salinum]|uniref:Uncharacterized protein n=1 Tax=Roseibium salinum TaxID=1604349 RepID=A0ABT3QWV7_9HYPH|nr:hypothetical protein [Roseibium sp. DSM 29163]MCX2721328.1 hypothetical protein [Roseibium sp. DSM 29163]MDN3722203.1 hypothetical protein [Roseibium salinum]